MCTSQQTLIQIVQRHRLTTGEVACGYYKSIYRNSYYRKKEPLKHQYFCRVWKTTRKHNPRLRIHLVTEGRHKNEIMFQQKAPVKSIVYETPYNKVIHVVNMFNHNILAIIQW